MTRVRHISWLLIAFAGLLSTVARGQDIEQQQNRDHRTHVQIAPQFTSIMANGVSLQAWGGDFTLWYRFAERFDSGMAMQQVVSFKQNGAALLSSVTVKLRYHLTGGGIPSDHRWSQLGETRVIQTKGLEGGLSTTVTIDQVSANVGDGIKSYSGIGAILEDEFPMSANQSISVGLGVTRLTSGAATIRPIRVFASWQVYLN
jgi:hypothetical protein